MVTGSRTPDLVAKLKTKTHTLIAGVSEKLGGHDEGMDPHEILEAALAACTVITVQMYANRKQWPLISTDVKVQIVSEGKETIISREITFQGDLDAEQKDRLLVIANKCPIHNLLESQVTIQTQMIP